MFITAKSWASCINLPSWQPASLRSISLNNELPVNRSKFQHFSVNGRHWTRSWGSYIYLPPSKSIPLSHLSNLLTIWYRIRRLITANTKTDYLTRSWACFIHLPSSPLISIKFLLVINKLWYQNQFQLCQRIRSAASTTQLPSSQQRIYIYNKDSF